MTATVQRWALPAVLILLVVGFSITDPDKFATADNFRNIVNAQAPALFIALGAMIVLMAGEFDLSLGAILGVAQYLVLKLIVDAGIDWPAAIAITVAVAALIGLVNGIFVAVIRVNSFIATIGMSSVLIGMLEWVSNGNAPIVSGAPKGFTEIFQSEVAGLTLPVFYALAAVVVLWVVTDYTVLGREVRASGANRRAAFLSGLRTQRSVIFAFVVAAMLAAIGGIFITGRIGAADATSGPAYLLPAYAAALLGATAIRPGSFNVWGTVIAIFVVAVGITGLQLAGAQSWVTPTFNGAVLLIAVTASTLAVRRRTGNAPA
jgi:ribose transport system permease protein